MIQDVSENPILTSVDTIFQKGHKSKFAISFQHSITKETKVVKEYLGIESDRQAMFWAMLFGMSIQSNSSIDLDTFSNYLNTTVLRVFVFQKDFDELVKRKLLFRQKSSRRRRGCESLNYLNLAIPVDLIYSVVNNEPLPKRRISNLSIYEILDVVFTLMQQRDDGFLDSDDLDKEFENLMLENKTNPVVRQILNYKLPPLDLAILLALMQLFVEGNSQVEWLRILRILSPESQKQIKIRKEWQTGNSKLQKIGLVDLETDTNFRNDKVIQLTQKGQELFGSDLSLFIEMDTPKHKNIIPSSSIVEKKLYFNEKESQQLSRLSEFLQVERHEELVRKLSELRFSSGLCVLFHGKPGTGKTESVLQLARQTGRDIFKVQISECRSKWHGESERLFRGIFTTYYKLLESSKVAPILLLNEIDAILGSRKNFGSGSADQSELSLIGIALNEMENFPSRGILMATSNLPNNIDKAFERRFLQKIYFDSPDSKTRSLIWKDNLISLTDDEFDFLSEKYPFSGGQITNIVKKAQIEILMGRKPDLKLIEEFCQEETLERRDEKRRIGYLV